MSAFNMVQGAERLSYGGIERWAHLEPIIILLNRLRKCYKGGNVFTIYYRSEMAPLRLFLNIIQE